MRSHDKITFSKCVEFLTIPSTFTYCFAGRHECVLLVFQLMSLAQRTNEAATFRGTKLTPVFLLCNSCSRERLSLLFMELSFGFWFPSRRKRVFYKQLKGSSLTQWKTGSPPCAANAYSPPTHTVHGHWAALDRYLREKKLKVYINLQQGRLYFTPLLRYVPITTLSRACMERGRSDALLSGHKLQQLQRSKPVPLGVLQQPWPGAGLNCNSDFPQQPVCPCIGFKSQHSR